MHTVFPPSARPDSVDVHSYLPEIDGLRTLAVLSVFLFHFDAKLLPGGFVGVDIFFVISGYLITGLLARDLALQQFSLLRFYQRRIARIAPAAFLVLVVIMVAGYFVYSSQDFSYVGGNALPAMLSYINIKLLHHGSYFQISTDAQPLIHYWSLAVEEQFYAVFPLLLYAATRWMGRVLTCLLICALASFAASIWMTPSAPIAAFYLLPTRGWELLAGSCLAIERRDNPEFAVRHGTACLAAGLLLVAVSFCVVRSEGFPGWIAALPVAGATFALAGIGPSRGGRLHAALAQPAMVYIGKRSYSLYLWHWPVFSFVEYQFYTSNPVFVGALKIVLSAAAAEFTYRFFERPVRAWLNAPLRRGTAFASFALAAVAVAVVGDAIHANFYLSANPRNVATGGVSINPRGHAWVVLIGDSQASMYGYDLAALARARGLRLNILSAAEGNELRDEPGTLWPKVLAFLGSRKPDVLILAQQWSTKLGEDGYRHFGDAISAVEHSAGQIIVLTEPPAPAPSFSRQAILAGARAPFLEPARNRRDRERATAIVHAFQNEHVHVIDVADIFLEKNGSIRAIGPNGRSIYQDVHHLSDTGTSMVLGRLDRAIQDALRVGRETARPRERASADGGR